MLSYVLFLFFLTKNLRISKKYCNFAPAFPKRIRGELTEWSKVPHSKCGVRITSYRGFESLNLRRVNEKDVH